MRFKSSKINEFRLWGLVLTLAGMTFMIGGTAGIVFEVPGAKIIAAIFLVLGLITMLGSTAIYFWAGMLSTSAVVIECPECHKPTKMLGSTDRCMYCKTQLSFHPPQESQS